MSIAQRIFASTQPGILTEVNMLQPIRGLVVPRIIITPDACLTCRRLNVKCNWGLPGCITCEQNGLQCVQPISTVGFDDYDHDGHDDHDDYQLPATSPKTTQKGKTKKNQKTKDKNKKKKMKKNEPKFKMDTNIKLEPEPDPEAENGIATKFEPWAEETRMQARVTSGFDDGTTCFNMGFTPGWQARDLPIPIPANATPHCSRQAAPYTFGSGSGAGSGAGAGSSYASGPVGVSQYESHPVAASQYASGPVAASPYTSGPVAVPPYEYRPVAGSSFTSGPVAGSPYASHPMAASSYASGPVGVSPYASGPVGVSPYASHPVAGPSFTPAWAPATVSAPEFTSEAGSASAWAPAAAYGSAFESVFIARIKRHLYKSQQRELERTRRHVRRSGSASSGADKDHDYAAYYDYDRDFDPDLVQKRYEELSKMKSQTELPPGFYVVNNSWKGLGEPPLKVRLDDFVTYMKENHLEPEHHKIHLPLSLLASCNYTASDTLFYYEKRLANYGVVPIPDINPVNPKLIRLGYVNPLVLQLFIAQRINHREVSTAILPTGESAEQFHIDAITQCGPKIDNYLAGGEYDMPALFLASIVISLVERARLDKLSQAYNHSTAAKAIFADLHRLNSDNIFVNMPEYLIEYYMHTVSFACVATDPSTAADIPFISLPQLSFADGVADTGYVGKLCGTWLDTLVTIPHIFRLGAIMWRRHLGTSTFQGDTKQFLDFGDIEARLGVSAQCEGQMAIYPYEKVAQLFKASAALYLWSLLDEAPLYNPDAVVEDVDVDSEWYQCEDQDERRSMLYRPMMKSMVHQAERLLRSIPPEDSFNHALCWPMLIVGILTREKGMQAFIEQRLIGLANQSCVGNPLETLFILKHAWKLARHERTPWAIWRYVQDSRCRQCSCPRCMPFLF